MKNLMIFAVLMAISSIAFAGGAKPQGGSFDRCSTIITKATFQSYTACDWNKPKQEYQACRMDYIDKKAEEAGC